jgi:integrase
LEIARTRRREEKVDKKFSGRRRVSFNLRNMICDPTWQPGAEHYLDDGFFARYPWMIPPAYRRGLKTLVVAALLRGFIEQDNDWRTLLSSATLPGAKQATEEGDSVARPRWQSGWLFKRGEKNPMWIARFREDYLNEEGSRLRREKSVVLGPVRDLGKRQASRLLSERLATINQGRHKPEMVINFERFILERWEPNLLPTFRFSTARKYRHLIRGYLLPSLGKLNLSEIGPADAQEMLTNYSKRLAPHTVLTIRNTLSKILGTAQKWGYIQTNAATGAQTPALINQRDRRVLTADEARRLLAVLHEPYHTMVLLALLSGLRRSEIFGLKWRYVDFQENSVIVAETCYQGHMAAPKTRASRRKVFLDPAVVEALRKLRPDPCQPDALIFATSRGTPLNPANVSNRVLIPACGKLGLPRVGWHNFRYTYATWADPTGESIKALQAQLGHTDSKLTLSVYTQPMPEAQRQIARKTAGVLLPAVVKFGNFDPTGKETIQ